MELKSKYFVASCGKVRWDDACVAEYLQKAVSNGNCWRFDGLVLYTLSILRNQKGHFQEPQAVWIDFQEPEEVGVVVSPICREESFYQSGFEVGVFRGMLCSSLAE